MGRFYFERDFMSWFWLIPALIIGITLGGIIVGHILIRYIEETFPSTVHEICRCGAAGNGNNCSNCSKARIAEQRNIAINVPFDVIEEAPKVRK